MIEGLDRAFAREDKVRASDFQIIVTPPAPMSIDQMESYAEIGVERLIVNLGSQRPELVQARLVELASLAKRFM
jgi:hypothetical protein